MENQFSTHTTLGKASLIVALLAVVFFIISIIIMIAAIFLQNPFIIIFSSFFSILMFIFSLIAIILGAISYWGSDKDKYGLYAFVIGLVFMILAIVVPIAMSATVYVYVSGMMGAPDIDEVTPSVSLMVDAQDTTCTVTVTSVSSNNINWNNIDWTLYDSTNFENIYYGVNLPSYGGVQAGQTISVTDLTDNHDYRLTLTYIPTGNAVSMVSWTQ